MHEHHTVFHLQQHKQYSHLIERTVRGEDRKEQEAELADWSTPPWTANFQSIHKQIAEPERETTDTGYQTATELHAVPGSC